MPSANTRRAATAAVVSISLAAAGPAALAAQSASASAPAPPTRSWSLLDGVLGTLGTLLNPTALTDLTTLSAQLSGGTAATPARLAPLTTLLQSLGSTQPDAAAVAALLQGSGTNPVNPAFLGEAQTLLGELAAVPGLSGPAASTLTSVQAALQGAIADTPLGGAVAGLPLSGGPLSLDPAQLSALTTLLTQLTNGQGATGAALAPIVAILREVAAGLPAPAADAVDEVADALEATTATLPSALVSQVSGLLMAVAATDGVSGTPLAGVVAQLAGVLDRTAGSGTDPGTGTGSGGGSTTTTSGGTTTTGTTTGAAGGGAPKGTIGTVNATGTPSTGAIGGASGGSGASAAKAAPRITRTKWLASKKAFSVTFSCPAGGSACVALVALVRNSAAASAITPVVLKPGATATSTIKLDSASKRLIKRKAVRFTLTSVTSRTRVATRSVKAAKAKAPKASKTRK